MKNDIKKKVENLISISNDSYRGDPKSSTACINEALKLLSGDDFDLKGRCYYCLSRDCLVTGEFDRATFYANKGLELVAGRGLPIEIKLLNILGNISADHGRFEMAIDYYMKALEKNDELYEEAVILNNIGEIYKELKSHSKAIEYYQKVIDTGIDNSSIIGVAYINNAEVNIQIKEYDKAKECLDKALDIFINTKDLLSQAYIYHTYGNLYKEVNDAVLAEKYYKQGYERYGELGDKFNVIHLIIDISGLLIKTGKYNEAISYIEDGLILCKETNNYKYQDELYQQLAYVYEKRREFDKAIKYHKLYYSSIRDKQDNIRNRKIQEVMSTINTRETKAKAETFYLKNLELANKTKELELKKISIEESYKAVKHINEIGRKLSKVESVKEIVRILYDGLKNFFSVETVGIGICDFEKGLIRYDNVIEKDQFLKPFEKSLNDRTSLGSWVVKNNKELIINNFLKEHSEYLDVSDEYFEGMKTQSLLFYPIGYEGNTIGVVSMQSIKKDVFKELEKMSFLALSSFINIACNNLYYNELLNKEIEIRKKTTTMLEELNDQLEISSNIDGLTKIYNRRHIKREFLKLDKDRKLALMVIDLDYFKKYNDKYGHLMGDEALVNIAGILNEHQTERSIFARYGGEEFVAISSYDDFDEVISIIDSLNVRIKERSIEHFASPTGYLTISIGVSMSGEGEERDFDQLFTKADSELYKAKAKGRNCYSVMNGMIKNVEA